MRYCFVSYILSSFYAHKRHSLNFCSLSELSVSCRIKLASNLPLLHQAVNIATSRLPEHLSDEIFDMKTRRVVAYMLLCISFTSQTHEFLTNSELIEGIVHVCQMKRPLSTGNASDIMVMIW